MRKRWKLDLDHGRNELRHRRLFEVAAKIAVRYGSGGCCYKNWTDYHIRECWEYKHESPCPTVNEIECKTNVRGIKWYIHNVLDLREDGPEDSADFLNGLCMYGKIVRHKKNFDSFRWYRNDSILELLQSCAFGGQFGTNISKQDNKQNNIWSFVPALSLRYSESGLFFFAGVLASGKLIKKGNETYAEYKGDCIKYLKKWHIPFEYVSKKRQVVQISPFWPALFSLKMTPKIAEKWVTAQNPIKGKLYASILWKVYVDNKFPKNGIPFLPARRSIFYQHKCEEGSMKRLEFLRVTEGLVELDNGILNMVRLWPKRGESNEISID